MRRDRPPDATLDAVPQLSARELEVLRLVVAGYDNAEIAALS